MNDLSNWEEPVNPFEKKGVAEGVVNGDGTKEGPVD